MKPARADTGFSLVEVMVVVAIIGLMAGAVVMAIPSSDTRLERVAETTERAFVALSRESVLTGRVIGVRFDAEGFQTLAATDNGWQVDADVLKPDALRFGPASFAALEVAGVEMEPKTGEVTPHIWFLPTGEQPPFKLTLTLGDTEAVLTGSGDGRFKVKRHD
ncbi:MAG: type II secretion system protein GspH [Alphaproteobacteria bacterium]|nr:MAG: type II secretion system protein GspH [Alphaproteobacteria bacterium]